MSQKLTGDQYILQQLVQAHATIKVLLDENAALTKELADLKQPKPEGLPEDIPHVAM